MLTRKQHDLLKFINDRQLSGELTPSFDEMKDALDLKSKSGIHRLITALEERGFIRRLANRARALEVIRMPDAAGAAAQPTQSAQPLPFRPSVVGGSDHVRRPIPSSQPAASNDSISVPVMGRIAAGVLIAAIQTNTRDLALPADMIRGGEHYALDVAGDSMIDAGILDGDTVLIRRSDTAAQGDIVVALVDDEEATLKRFLRKGDRIVLEAANPAYEPRIFSADRVQVQGKLVGLIRRY